MFFLLLSLCKMLDNEEITEVDDGLVEYTVPSSCVSLLINFFGSKKTLKKVSFNGTKCTKLSNAIFFNCTELISINLEKCRNLTSIPVKCFAFCSGLKSICIPQNVKHICSEAFFNCINLKNLTFIGESKVTDIQLKAFSGTAFSEFKIPQKCRLFLPRAFICSGIERFITDKSIYTCIDNISLFRKQLPSELIFYPPGRKDPTYTIPFGTKTLSYESFGYHNFLRNIIFPSTLEKICNSAFRDINLKRIEIPLFVKEIDSEVFYTSRLNEIIINARIKELKSALFAKSGSLTSVVLPSTLEIISPDAFAYCKSLVNITVSSNVRDLLLKNNINPTIINVRDQIRVFIRRVMPFDIKNK